MPRPRAGHPSGAFGDWAKPKNKKVDWANANTPLTVIARSPCDEAIQGPRAVAPGLLRRARCDGRADAAIIGHGSRFDHVDGRAIAAHPRCIPADRARRPRYRPCKTSRAGRRCAEGGQRCRMADIFVSYTSSDRESAFWIGVELEKLGHQPRVHEWEISAGGDIAAWMEERHHNAEHILCVVSKTYLTKDYSNWERRAAQWAAASTRHNFALPIFIEECEAPTLLAHVKRCDLYGLSEGDARAKLEAYLKPAAKPVGPVQFPAAKSVAKSRPFRPANASFPGRNFALSN